MNDKFTKAMEAWDETTTEFSDYGAADSEPSRVLEYVIEKYINDGKNILPLNASKWELFSSMDGVELVAGVLNEKAQEIIDVLESLKYSEVKAIAEYYGY
jgi:hypothetical protein